MHYGRETNSPKPAASATTADVHSEIPSTPCVRRGCVADAAAVILSFLLYAAITAPAPALNEPHYLGKARHYWQPDWCAGDFFLASTDAHVVFFATLGWFASWCSFPVAAWIGRFVALTILGAGWSACSRQLVAHPYAGAMSAWLFLGLTTIGNWSGEWLVGGVESKVVTYGLIFWAWALLWDRRWIASAACAGAAIAFHPVVGLWAALATAFAWMRRAFWRWRLGVDLADIPTHCPQTPAGRWTTISAVVLLMVLALPGLLPVLRIVLEPVDAQTRYAGTYLQVFYRLVHHLDPLQFPLRAHVSYTVLISGWCLGALRGPRTAPWSWLRGIVAASLLFALAGVAVSWGPRPPHLMPGFEWRMHLLKFYPFRLADALVPIGVCWVATGWLVRTANQAATAVGGFLIRTSVPSAVAALLISLTLVAAGKLYQSRALESLPRYDFAHDPDWRDVCEWMKHNSPPDALVHTPHISWTFKWYAERAEYVTFKDCPQDVRGIVEWNRRLLQLTRLTEAFVADGLFSRDELRLLRRQTGITHIVTDKLGPMALPAVYRNDTFQVYDLRELDLPAAAE